MKKIIVSALAVLIVSGCAAVKPVPRIKDVRPISAVVVSQCGLALALYIQLDSNNLFRADPKQSELFTNNDGDMVHTFGDPMAWDEAYELASKAVLSSHVTVPCPDGPIL